MKRKEDVNKKAVTNENLLKTSDNATHTYFVKVDYVPLGTYGYGSNIKHTYTFITCTAVALQNKINIQYFKYDGYTITDIVKLD